MLHFILLLSSVCPRCTMIHRALPILSAGIHRHPRNVAGVAHSRIADGTELLRPVSRPGFSGPAFARLPAISPR